MKIYNDKVSQTPDSDVLSRLKEKMLHIRNKNTSNETHIEDETHVIASLVPNENTDVVTDPKNDNRIENGIAEATDKPLIDTEKDGLHVHVTSDLDETITLSNDERKELLNAAKAGYSSLDSRTENSQTENSHDVEHDTKHDVEHDDTSITIEHADDTLNNRNKWVMMCTTAFMVVMLIVGCIFALQNHIHTPTKQALMTFQLKHKSKNESSQTALKEKLEAAAKATGKPYKISTSEIGGDYISGTITYYPDDSTKTYMESSIIAPEKPLKPTDDTNANIIEYKLKTSLPTINNTITVKDPSKVTMATYKQKDDSYNTILMYNGKPFGYVTTDKDNNMVNNVTTYYIKKVQNK